MGISIVNDAITSYKIESLEHRVSTLTKELDQTVADFTRYKEEQTKKENNRLIAGIIFLGSMVLALIGYIWKVVAGG